MDSSFTITIPEAAVKFIGALGETAQSLFVDALLGRLDAEIGEIKRLGGVSSQLESLKATLSSS